MNKKIANLGFIAICVGIILFLLAAPKETTPKLPHDNTHEHLHKIKSKKKAERFCVNCHNPDEIAPLPSSHPPEYRCLLCHKRD